MSDQPKDFQQAKVSIVMATFNALHYLPECLESIRRQAFRDLEIIVQDGGSTDGTINYLKLQTDLPMKLFVEPDKGIYDALNKAVLKAGGKWLLFLGADDRLLEGFSTIAKNLKETTTIYYGRYFHGEQQEGKAISTYDLAKMNYCHQAIFYPRSIFLKYKYDLAYPVFADYKLNMQCWGDSEYKKQFAEETVVRYDMGGFSAS